MMCEAARMLLDAYLDNQLSPLQRGKVDEHLRECKACSRIVDESRGYLVCLEAYYDFIKPSDSLVESALYNLSDAEIGKKRTASELKSSGSSSKFESPAPPGGKGRRWPILAAAALVLGVAGYFAWRSLSVPASVAVVDDVSGAVERRAAGSTSFAAVASGAPLSKDDVVRTAAGAAASVSAKEFRLEIQGSSSVTIRGESLDRLFEVAVDQGSAAVEAVRGENRFVVATPAARATVVESKDYVARVTVEVRPAESVFSVTRGAFVVAGGGSEVLVAEGRRTAVKPGRAPGPPEASTSGPTTPPNRTSPPKDRETAPSVPPIVEAARRGEAECLAAVLASPSLGRSELPTVVRWVEQQKRPEDIRRGAIALSAIARSVPGNAPEAVAALSKIALGDASDENRAAAVEALAGTPGSAAVKALESVALRDKDAAVARRAAAALALRDGAEASASLVAVLKGAVDASVKKEAGKGALFADPAAAAAALGDDLPPELPALAAEGPAGLARAFGLTRDPAIRFQLLARAETVAAGANPADTGLGALGDELSTVTQSDANPLLRRRAALSLGAVPQAASPASVAALVAARSDREEPVRVAAALAHLRREGKDGGGVVAATFYQQLRTAESKLDFASGLTRVLPAEAAAPVLQKISEGERIAPLKVAVEALRRSLAGAGGAGERPPVETGGGDPSAGLNDPDPAVRARTVTALGRRPPDDTAARDAIFAALEDAEESVRAAAVAVAGRYKDDDAFEALRGILARDPSTAVKSAALPLVAGFNQREDLAEVLGTALGEEPDEELRVKIVQALTRVQGTPATEALVRALASDGSPLVQSSVLRALGGRKERAAGQALADALSSSDPTVVGEAVTAFRQFAGQPFPYDPEADPDAAGIQLSEIRDWWAANADSYE